MAGHSFGVLWAAHKKIHCSVAVIWVQVPGWQCACKRTAKPFNSMQNCLQKEFEIIIATIFILRRNISRGNVLIYRKCSYFQTPSSCDSGIVRMTSILAGSFLMSCWMYCCTARVLSISSNGSSGQRLQSWDYNKIFHEIFFIRDFTCIIRRRKSHRLRNWQTKSMKNIAVCARQHCLHRFLFISMVTP